MWPIIPKDTGVMKEIEAQEIKELIEDTEVENRDIVEEFIDPLSDFYC